MSATKLPDAALLGAVADLLAEEHKARHASVRDVVAELARSRERIDEYGNVIETKFQALEMTALAPACRRASWRRLVEGRRAGRGRASRARRVMWPARHRRSRVSVARSHRPARLARPVSPARKASAACKLGLQGEKGLHGEAGPMGPGAPLWRHRRAYDPTVKDYRAGDVVAHDGGSSVALVDDPGACPVTAGRN